MTDLIRHLRSGFTVVYLKDLVVRNRRILAYVIMAAAVAYAVYGVQQESRHRTDSLAATREARSNDIIASLAEGSVVGCITANVNTLGMHKVVIGSYNAGKASIQQFVVEGTLTVTQAKRIQHDSFDTTRQYLRDLPYRDCDQAASRYVKQITDRDQRIQVTNRVAVQAAEAKLERLTDEPELKP